MMVQRLADSFPPTLTLPLQGGGDKELEYLNNITPSPLEGEGWGGEAVQ